jgi:hypothetical protein
LSLKNEGDIADLKKTSTRELAELYKKFTNIVQKLRRKDSEDWDLRTKRLKDQASLIKEQGEAVAKRNGDYVQRILELINEQKSNRNDHAEALNRLKAEEANLKGTGDKLEQKVNDNVNILK